MVRPIFTKFGTMTHIDLLNPTGPNEILFTGQTRVRSKSHVLVAGANWRQLANTIEPSAVPAKRQQRVQVRQRVRTEQRLSLYALLTHSSVKLNSPIRNPLRCGLLQNSLIT